MIINEVGGPFCQNSYQLGYYCYDEQTGLLIPQGYGWADNQGSFYQHLLEDTLAKLGLLKYQLVRTLLEKAQVASYSDPDKIELWDVFKKDCPVATVSGVKLNRIAELIRFFRDLEYVIHKPRAGAQRLPVDIV